MELVRIATAGSVDDGKSTLIGRLLLETESLLDDQLRAIQDATIRRGESGFNLALITDGLRAEREQNITIDVAYRPFQTARRRFILADSPGHVQYTRNMVTAASTADIVIVLVDASRGQTTQSRRHLAIASLLSASIVVLAINKMDAVDYSEDVFRELVDDLTAFARKLGRLQISSIPVSALVGDNVVNASYRMPWYDGPSLLEFLESVSIPATKPSPARLPIQNVLLGPSQTRYYAGTLAGGSLQIGSILRSPSGHISKVKNILAFGELVPIADPSSPVAVQLTDELDISRGDWLVDAEHQPLHSNSFLATLFWLQGDALRLGMSYRLRQGPRLLVAKVTKLIGRLDFETGQFAETGSLAPNDVAKVEVELSQSVPLDTYETDRDLGSFVLVDANHQTVAAGRIDQVCASEGRSRVGQVGRVLWLTGLSGAGKSTLAEGLMHQLTLLDLPAIHLDGDTLRSGLCSDLGFSPGDRLENIRRTAEVARLLADQGMIVVCSLISPLVSQRALAREILQDAFIEVHVKCDVEECIRRDPKGLYARALDGQISNFTGVSAPYESPPSPELMVDTQHSSASDGVRKLMGFLTL